MEHEEYNLGDFDQMSQEQFEAIPYPVRLVAAAQKTAEDVAAQVLKSVQSPES